MLKRGIPVLPIHTADGVREQFMELLGHRPMRQREQEQADEKGA